MQSLVMKDLEMKTPPSSEVIIEMGETINAIAEYNNAKNAIGYSYFYYVNTMYKRDTVKMLEVNGVKPTIETIKDGTYPIYTNGFIVTRADKQDNNISRWINTVLSERGSRIIEKAGYVPMN